LVFSIIPPIFASYYSSLKKQKMDIPSAEEYYSKTMFPALSKYKPDEIKLWFETNTDAQQSVNIMIEFARLHVQAALKAADDNADVTVIDVDMTGTIWGVDSETILNAYPLENIK